MCSGMKLNDSVQIEVSKADRWAIRSHLDRGLSCHQREGFDLAISRAPDPPDRKRVQRSVEMPPHGSCGKPPPIAPVLSHLSHWAWKTCAHPHVYNIPTAPTPIRSRARNPGTQERELAGRRPRELDLRRWNPDREVKLKRRVGPRVLKADGASHDSRSPLSRSGSWLYSRCSF